MKTNFYVNVETVNEHVDFFLSKLTLEIQQLASQLETTDTQLWGYQDREIIPIKFDQVYSIYAVNNHVVAATNAGILTLKQKLYQLELELPSDFIRISKSEIINYHCIDHLEVSKNGLINIILTNGARALVSRRCMSNLKRRLGL